MGSPVRNQPQMGASGSPERYKTVPTNSARQGQAGWCLSKTSRGTPNKRSSSWRIAKTEASRGGARLGEEPQQPDKPRRSGEMVQTRRSTSRTEDIVSQRRGHVSARKAGFRQPAVQASSSAARSSLAEYSSSPRSTSRCTLPDEVSRTEPRATVESIASSKKERMSAAQARHRPGVYAAASAVEVDPNSRMTWPWSRARPHENQSAFNEHLCSINDMGDQFQQRTRVY